MRQWGLSVPIVQIVKEAAGATVLKRNQITALLCSKASSQGSDFTQRKSQSHEHNHRVWLHTSLISRPFTLQLSDSTPATLASFLFLNQAKHIPTMGPLLFLFLLPRTLPQTWA